MANQAFRIVNNNGLVGTSVNEGWTDQGTDVKLTDAGDSVGIGTASPNQKLTVVGGISSQTIIYDQTTNSVQWGDTFTILNASSAQWNTDITFDGSEVIAASGQWNNTELTLNPNSGFWSNAYTVVYIFLYDILCLLLP